MTEYIQDFVTTKDVKCPICGNEMKKFQQKQGKTHFKCEKCGYMI